jgi:hypothetical protein
MTHTITHNVAVLLGIPLDDPDVESAPTPYLVIAAVHREPGDTPPTEEVLAWLRSEGIDPMKGNRCEVYEGRDGRAPYAIVSLFEYDTNGGKVFDEVTDEAVTYADIVLLTSLPPLRDHPEPATE